MAEFSKLKMTERGKELLNNGMLAEDSLEFTRAVLSAHVYAEEELGALESLEEVWRGIPVRSTTVEKGAVTVDFMVSNENMESGHFIRAVGLYAKAGAGEEVLFVAAVEKSGGCYMPEHSETVTSLQVKLRFRIDNAERVMLMVDAGGTAAMGDVLEVRSLVLEEAGRAETAETELKRQIEAEVGRASEREAALEDAKLDKDGDASGVTVDFQPSKQPGPPEPLQPGGTLGEQFGRLAKAVSDLVGHLEDGGNPHKTTKAQVGLGNADNTADMDKPVSAAQQEALDALYAQMAAYADKKTADLINGAPSTLDTLGEIAEAMGENADVVSALEAAIGTKADAAEFDSHVKDKTAHVTEAEKQEWNNKLSTAGGNIAGSLSVSGEIGAGSRARLWTDCEGGNLQIQTSDGTKWEIDAFNGNLRIFNYENGSTNGIVIDKLGHVTFPCDAWAGTFYGNLSGRAEVANTAKEANSLRIGGGDSMEFVDPWMIKYAPEVNSDPFCLKVLDDIVYWDADHQEGADYNFKYGSFYAEGLGDYGQPNLGESFCKWKSVYVQSGTIQTSDRTKKKEIKPLDDELTKKFIMGLTPSSYSMTDGTSGRTHWGMIAQDIEALMAELGMTSMDFAGFIKSSRVEYEEIEEETGAVGGNGSSAQRKRKRRKERIVEGEYDYSLRYDEFIAPIIRMVQIQQDEINGLKRENDGLKERLGRIEEALGIGTAPCGARNTAQDAAQSAGSFRRTAWDPK